MALGKIKTLFSDKGKTEALFPRTKTSAVSNADGVGLDALLENIHHDLDTKATEAFVENKIEEVIGSGNIDVDLSNYATKNEVNVAINNIDFPVDSVNGKVGAVVLSAEDIGAATEAELAALSALVGDKAVSEQIDEAIDKIEIPEAEKQVQVDWNQNDSEQVDFIKNKPFYNTESEYRAIFEKQVIEGTLANGFFSSKDLYFDLNEPLLSENETYKIVISDGTNIYENVSVAQVEKIDFENKPNEVIVLTNVDLSGNIAPTGDYFAFSVIYELDGIQDYIYFSSGRATLGFQLQNLTGSQFYLSLYKKVAEEKKIEQRYTHNADWHENNLNANGYIKNKPFKLVDSGQTLVLDATLTFEAGEQTCKQTFTYLSDFDHRTDNYLVAWDGVEYFCPTSYFTVDAMVDGVWGPYQIFQCGFKEGDDLQAIKDYPFALSAIRPKLDYYYQIIDKLIISLPKASVNGETHTIKLYRTGKKWEVEQNFIPTMQSNWNETDENSPNYIQNRPIYKYLDDSNSTILDQKFENFEENDYGYTSNISIQPIDILEGYEYKLYLYYQNGGYLYRSLKPVFPARNMCYFGNGALFGVSEDSGENFALGFSTEDGTTYVTLGALDPNTFVSVKINGPTLKYSKLDERYLPDNIITQEKWKQSDWAQNNSNSNDYIKNRTHWVEGEVYHPLDKRFLPEEAVQKDTVLSKINLADKSTGVVYELCIYNGELVISSKCIGIEVTTMPTKTNYVLKEEFDPTGLVISAVYSDGSRKEITDYSYEVIEAIGEGKVVIRYAYEEENFETELKITFEIVDFEYVDNNDGTITINSWNGTLNGEPSTECVIPDGGSTTIII